MKIIQTQDGSSTIISNVFENQLYHSQRGAVGEAQHVYTNFIPITIQNIENNAKLNILEVGLGTGLNALQAYHSNHPINYAAIELYPVPIEIIRNLSFYDAKLEQIHTANWEEWSNLSENFALKKIVADITKPNAIPTGKFNLIYFDPFAPQIVPNQWSVDIFNQIFAQTQQKGVLVTYSAKGDVKRALREAGFEVKRLDGALGKHNMIMATKQ